MLDRGIHPVRIGEGFDRACQAAVTHLEKISDAVEFTKDNTEVGCSLAFDVGFDFRLAVGLSARLAAGRF